MKLERAVAQRVVDRIAGGLEKSVSVADAAGRIIASTEDLRVGERSTLARRALAEQTMVESDGGHPAETCLPLEYADELVGAIVITVDAQHGTDAARVAKVLAELIIHQMLVIEQLPHQQWARNKFIGDLLNGALRGPPDAILHEARLFAIDLNIPRVVVAFDIAAITGRLALERVDKSALPGVTRAVLTERLHRELQEQLHRAAPLDEADLLEFVDDRWLVVLPATGDHRVASCRDTVVPWAQSILDELQRSGNCQTAAGVGRFYGCWEGLAQSFEDACCAAETGAGLYGAGRVYCIEDLGLASFVCSHDPRGKRLLARDLLAPVNDDPELMATLDRFLQSDLSPSRAADMLHIHRHTLAYRLDKIARLTGLDPRRFDAAAQLYAALMVWKLGCRPSGADQTNGQKNRA